MRIVEPEPAVRRVIECVLAERSRVYVAAGAIRSLAFGELTSVDILVTGSARLRRGAKRLAMAGSAVGSGV